MNCKYSKKDYNSEQSWRHGKYYNQYGYMLHKVKQRASILAHTNPSKNRFVTATFIAHVEKCDQYLLV